MLSDEVSVEWMADHEHLEHRVGPLLLEQYTKQKQNALTRKTEKGQREGWRTTAIRRFYNNVLAKKLHLLYLILIITRKKLCYLNKKPY
jgi:hypothetical protein